MKLAIVVLSITLCFTGFTQENTKEAEWLTSLEEAKTLASTENKLILINFAGSDWCLPCAKLERDLFNTEEFLDYSKQNLILLKADFPVKRKNQLSETQKQHNYKLAETYNKQGTFPVVVIINDKGKVKSYVNTSLSSTDAYLSELKKVANNSVN